MSECSALATKQEVKALEQEISQLNSQINGKINRSEKPEIVQAGGGLGLTLATAALSPQVRAVLAKVGALASKLAGLASKLLGVLNIIASLATIAYATYLEYRVGKAEAKIRTLDVLVGANEIEIKQLQAENKKLSQEVRNAKSEANVASQLARAASQDARNARQQADRAIGIANDANDQASLAFLDAAKAVLQATRANVIATGATKIARQAKNEAEVARKEANEAITISRSLAQEVAQIRSENKRLAAILFSQSAKLIGLEGAADAALKEALKKADGTEIDEQGREIRRVRAKTVTNFGDITELKSSSKSLENSILTRDREFKNEVKKLEIKVRQLQGDAKQNKQNLDKTRVIPLGRSGISEGRAKELINTEVAVQVGAQSKVNDRQYQDLITGITGIGTLIGGLNIPDIRTKVTDIDTNVSTTVSQTRPQALTDAAAAGVCQTTRPGGCMEANVTQPLQNRMDSLINAGGAAFSAANNALLLRMQNTLLAVKGATDIIRATTEVTMKAVTHTKHGLQATEKFASTAWKVTRADKVMAGVSMALTVHNAMMLSNNLLSTVSEATNMSLNALGIRTEEDKPIDFGRAVKEKIAAVLTASLGEAQYAALTARIAKANRIYQASINVLDTTYSLFDSARSVAELTAENTGKIGNALRDAGVVYEDAYSEFIERVNPQNAAMRRLEKFREGTESIENVFSSISQVSSDVVEFKENVTQLKEEKDNLAEEIATEIEIKTTEKAEARTEVQVTAEIDEVDFERDEANSSV